MSQKNLIVPALCVSVLLIPLIGMQLTDSIRWSVWDFVVMGFLLLGLGFGIRSVASKRLSTPKKRMYIVLLVLVFMLIWAELSVGVFGTPFAGD
ncbi:MAG: hypothetical protein ACPF80_01520 [Flavobacteriaceae bacterium]